MRIFGKLSLALTITFLAQLIWFGCDSSSNNAPIITQIVADKTSVKTGESVKIQVASVGADLTYNWKVFKDGVSQGDSEKTTTNSWTFSSNTEGTFTIKVWATNSYGTSTVEEIDVEVKDDAFVITASTDKSHLDVAGDVTATINTTGSDYTYYFKLDSESSTSSSSNSKKFTISEDGSHTIKVWVIDGSGKKSNEVSLSIYLGKFPVHSNITASTFWCGEGASGDNDFITNTESAWDSHWGEHFGLEDHPTNISRDSDHIPTSSKYKKTENPYYFALPYNDYGSLVYDGDNATVDTAATDTYGHKKNAYNVVYWADEQSTWNSKSMCKNRWIKITDNESGKTCYAQWEDAGPYYYNDHNYVFGTGSPANNTDYPYAAIDLSPSVSLYFGKYMQEWGAGDYKVSWQFVAEGDVPDGPWTKYKTTQQVYWD